MKKSAIRIAILLIAAIPVLFLNSCQKEQVTLIEESLSLKSGEITNVEPILYWGHETFTRETGNPDVVKMKIGSEDLMHFETGFVLRLKNGDGKSNLVSSAIIKLDGKQIFGPSDFSKKVTTLSRGITGLSENSELEVELRSTPGSFIDVWIEGTLKPGNAIIDENGGEFVSDDGLLRISVPSNAVSEKIFFNATFTDVTLPTDIPGEIKGPVYLLEPSGIEFDNPVTIKLKYNPELFNNINNIRIFHWRPEQETYDIIVPDNNVNSNELTFTIDHFSMVGTFESENSEPENYVIINGIKFKLNLGYNVWFSELDCGNFDVFAHGLYLTYDISINKYGDSETGMMLLPSGIGNILVFNMFSKYSELVAGQYVFVDEVDCNGNVTDGGNAYLMSETDKFVTAVTEANESTHYALDINLAIDWSTVDFNNPSTEVINKITNYQNSKIGIKEGTITIEKTENVYSITFNCTDSNGSSVSGKYTGNLEKLEFGI